MVRQIVIHITPLQSLFNDSNIFLKGNNRTIDIEMDAPENKFHCENK